MKTVITTTLLGAVCSFMIGCSTVKSTGEAVGTAGKSTGRALGTVSDAVGNAGRAVGEGAGDIVSGTGNAIERAADRTERKGY
jgi:hypothetical protein